MNSSLTMTDRLLMEPTFDMEDEEEEGGAAVEEVEERQAEAVEEVVTREEQRVGEVEEGEEVDLEEEDLEQSLQALEKLDRSSPDLWPDQIPGAAPLHHFTMVKPLSTISLWCSLSPPFHHGETSLHHFTMVQPLSTILPL